jgi:hypothetical protein
MCSYLVTIIQENHNTKILSGRVEMFGNDFNKQDWKGVTVPEYTHACFANYEFLMKYYVSIQPDVTGSSFPN